MSALARYFNSQGKTVLGYDRTRTPLTIELESEGISVHYEDDITNIPAIVTQSAKNEVLIIMTPAIPADSAELNFLRAQDYTIIKRSELLGRITSTTKTIAVAGTHGKTTTSSLIAHILTSSGHGCNAFLGGITANYNTNLLLAKGDVWTVVEADEFDRSFLTLTPDVAVITSMDADHLDIYGTHDELHISFRMFIQKIRKGGILIHKSQLPVGELANDLKVYDYSNVARANYMAENISISEGVYHFDLAIRKPGEEERWMKGLTLGLPGRHNVENAIAASAVCLEIGITEEELRQALASFRGVRRRFEYVIRRADFVQIDDYAHHPAEIEACVRSVREMYPDKKILGIFQPHLFTRTRDFADEFARSLSLLDKVILLPIYPARELPIPGIDSQMLLDKISGKGKKLVEKSGLLDELMREDATVVITLGAGDIENLVQPMKAMFEKRLGQA